MPTYYPVTTADDLAAALGTIGGQIASCNFGLGGKPPVPDNIAVNGGGMRIPRDTTHMNGWDYGTGQMSIVLYGSYCDRAKAGTLNDVQAIFGCREPLSRSAAEQRHFGRAMVLSVAPSPSTILTRLSLATLSKREPPPRDRRNNGKR